MSAADCRAGKCSCAAKSERLGEAERTVRQVQQSGWLNDDGSYDWVSGADETRVTPVWAKHVANGAQAIAEAEGWLIYQRNQHVPEAVARIRWEPTEAVDRG